VAVLGEMLEWEEEYSCQVFEMIQVYDRELADHRKDEADQHKVHQKHAKHVQDQAKFSEASNKIEEHI
jgi:hypothetical protein